MTEEAKANQKKWDESEAWFNKEYPDHEDGCLYGKILVKAAFTAGRESRDEYLKKLLKSNIDQHNKIGFLSRKVYALERQIEEMKCCGNCIHCKYDENEESYEFCEKHQQVVNVAIVPCSEWKGR